MKVSIIALALVLSVVATTASADPVSTAIASFFVKFGVSQALATAIGTFAARIVAGVAFSVAGQLLQQEPEGVKAGGIQTDQTTRGDTTPLKFPVGRYALEAHFVSPAYARRKTNTILTYIAEVSNIRGVQLTGRIVIDGEWATISNDAPVGRNDVSTASAIPEFQEDEGTLRDHAWMWYLDGTQTAAHPHLVAQYGDDDDRPWTEDHKLIGSCYAILEFVRDEDLFGQMPSVRFETESTPLYDPRKDSTVGGSGSHRWDDVSTWEPSDNPQVISYNVRRGIPLETGEIWGAKIPAADLPLDNWFAAMNECDVLIGSRKQFRAGFEINVKEMEPREVIREMDKASFAQSSEFGGIFRVRVGAPAAPVMSITDDDFVITEPSSFDPFPGLEETYNAITGSYVEPDDIWQARGIEMITNAEWEEEDGERRVMSMDLPAVFDRSQATHLLNAYIKDNRRFRTHRLSLPPAYAVLEPLDVITWTSDQNGYVAKDFEVVEVEMHPGTLIQTVTVRERDAGDVVWTSGDDVPAVPAYNQYTRPANLIPTLGIPANLVTSDIRVVRETPVNVVTITVTSSKPEQVPRVEVQYKEEGATEWTALGAGGLGVYELVSADIGNFQFRARTFGIEGKPGGWTVSTTVSTQSTFGNPDDVTGFAAEVNSGTTTLEWDPVANADLSYYLIRHAVETTGATWADATTAVAKVPRPGTSVAVPTRPGTFMIKAVDKTGLTSDAASEVVIPANEVPSFLQSLSDAEHTTFPGTKTGVEVNSSRLEITDPSSAPSEGTYDFDGYIETHDNSARRARVRVDAEVIRIDESSGGWDNIPGTWDQFPGTWDEWTGSQLIADTDVLFYVRTTTDDPAGTPTWGDWRQFRAGEFYGRAFQFRATLKSSTDNVTPSIGALTAYVEYDT